MLIERLTDLFKQTGSLDRALRYHPRYYAPLRRRLRELDGMDRAARRAVSLALLRRTFGWAARLPGGPAADVPLEQRPIIEREQLRDEPRRFSIRGWIRVPAATSGTTGVPVRMTRSLRCIAAEQAFIDDLMRDWQIDCRGARVARLRADTIKPLADTTPPYGVYRDGGRTLVLSSNHLNRDSAGWYHDELRRFRPQVLFAHPAVAETLAAHLQQRGGSLDIPLVMSSSETVHASGRRLMEAVFNGTVIDYYGMAERVALAAAKGGGGFYFNPLYGKVELLPVDDAEAPDGHRAFEIVATGFWNDAMPLVRYRAGDRVVVPRSYGEQQLEDVTLGLAPATAIQGRGKDHLRSPSGVTIVGVSNATNGVIGLLRMQVVQQALAAVRVNVVVDPRFGACDEATLLRNLRDYIPSDIAVTIAAVEVLERLPSGKTPFYILRAEV